MRLAEPLALPTEMKRPLRIATLSTIRLLSSIVWMRPCSRMRSSLRSEGPPAVAVATAAVSPPADAASALDFRKSLREIRFFIVAPPPGHDMRRRADYKFDSFIGS